MALGKQNFHFFSLFSIFNFMRFNYLFLLFILFGCAKQEPIQVLDSREFITNIPIRSTYKKEIVFKVQEKVVPLLVTWSSYYDSVDNCLKLVNCKIERTGGDPSVIFSNVRCDLSHDCELSLDPERVAVVGVDSSKIVSLIKEPKEKDKRYQIGSVVASFHSRDGLKEVELLRLQSNGEYRKPELDMDKPLSERKTEHGFAQ